MHRIPHLLVITLIFFASSCRKDPAIDLPEPNGNLLVLEVDKSFNILGGNELLIEELKVNSEFLEIETINSNTRWNIITKGSNDTIFDIANGVLTKPEVTALANLQEQEDRLYSFISASDLTSLYGEELETNEILFQIGNTSLIHAYLSKENHSKITFLSLIANKFDPELEISIPEEKGFFLIGFEI